jgi:hypothetical protein
MDDSARQIHDALQAVSRLRQQHAADPALAQASATIRRFQARRFQASYADLLHNPRYKAAAAFFLQELYSDKNYAERDQQFARIASTIAKIFPQSVVNTAAALAKTHALIEQLDDRMARQWLADRAEHPQSSECARYIRCWRQVGDVAERQRQLDAVLQLGQSLNRLTRMPGLRTLLKMMRRPAAAAGLTTLQQFLETGFDAFADMRGAADFLKLIGQRESEWIRSLFDDDLVSCETRLMHLLASDAAH